MSSSILVGNKVSIQFSTHPSIVGKVTYIPKAEGDCWHITSDNGDVYYVQRFDYMIKRADYPVR